MGKIKRLRTLERAQYLKMDRSIVHNLAREGNSPGIGNIRILIQGNDL